MHKGVPTRFFDKRFDPPSSGHTIGMSLPSETTEPSPGHDLFEDQENPVPTTEALNGEITMDPDAAAPAQEASEHLDALDSSAGRSSISSSSDGENSPGDSNAAVDNTVIDEAEVGD